MTGKDDMDKNPEMSRIDHWERLLAAAIDKARTRPFAWGLHDCPTFAFETRMVLTDGEDVTALWRGRYTTPLGGQRVMRRLGWASLEEMARALLREPRPAVLLAQRGDIAMTPYDIAKSYIGTTEGPGPENNPVIVEMYTSVGHD